MIELNESNLAVGQIKQILHSFNLPMFQVYREGFKYSKGEHYLKDGAVFNADGTKLKDYTFGERIFNMTTTMPISSNVYDSATHEYLGRYLRFMRDCIGLDLMGLYNCCGYDSPRDFDASSFITVEGGVSKEIRFSSKDSEYTLMMIPVRWGMKYTIAMDYHGSIEMACMHFEDNTMLDLDSSSNPRMIDGTYKKIRWARFNHPFVYDNLALDEVNLRKRMGDPKERSLKLFIKVPSSCSSSIVVLEGDYVDSSNSNQYMDSYKQKVGNCPLMKGVDPETGEEASYSFLMRPMYSGKNQLLSINIGQKSLLSDRLIEYLTKQAISPESDVTDNIKRVQLTLKSTPGLDEYSIKEYGIWDNSMREAICKYSWLTGIVHNNVDLLSYFDKDIESRIGGLRTKHKESDKIGKVFSNDTTGGR